MIFLYISIFLYIVGSVITYAAFCLADVLTDSAVKAPEWFLVVATVLWPVSVVIFAILLLAMD